MKLYLIHRFIVFKGPLRLLNRLLVKLSLVSQKRFVMQPFQHSTPVLSLASLSYWPLSKQRSTLNMGAHLRYVLLHAKVPGFNHVTLSLIDILFVLHIFDSNAHAVFGEDNILLAHTLGCMF